MKPLIKDEKTPLQIATEMAETMAYIKRMGWRQFSKSVISELGYKSRKDFAQKTGTCETVFYNDCPRCLGQFDVFFVDENKK